MKRQQLIHLLMAAAALTALPAWAQTGTIRIVVGYPAGATSDTLTRIVAEHMTATLKQTVIVENKAGAGGRIGNEVVKAAVADGTTLLMTPVAIDLCSKVGLGVVDVSSAWRRLACRRLGMPFAAHGSHISPRRKVTPRVGRPPHFSTRRKRKPWVSGALSRSPAHILKAALAGAEKKRLTRKCVTPNNSVTLSCPLFHPPLRQML